VLHLTQLFLLSLVRAPSRSLSLTHVFVFKLTHVIHRSLVCAQANSLDGCEFSVSPYSFFDEEVHNVRNRVHANKRLATELAVVEHADVQRRCVVKLCRKEQLK
jgi:hypothetical protein